MSELLGYNILSSLIREFQQPSGGYPASAVLIFNWTVSLGMLCAVLRKGSRANLVWVFRWRGIVRPDRFSIGQRRPYLASSSRRA